MPQRLRLIPLLLAAGAPAIGAQHSAPHGRPMYHAPRWSPDARSIAAVMMGSSGSRLVVIPSSGGTPVVVPVNGLQPGAADWTPNGRLIFVVDSANSRRRYIVDRDGRNLTAARADSVSSATSDSTTMLYERHRGGGSDIVVLNRTRTSARQLTSGFWAEQPSISPDGRTIVFERRIDPHAMEASDVVLMALDGTNQRVIARGTDPSWSPDGRSILFKSFVRDELWITIVDVATKVERRLVRGVHPQWSPDGERIVYMHDAPDGGADIYIVAKTGVGARCLTCAAPTRP